MLSTIIASKLYVCVTLKQRRKKLKMERDADKFPAILMIELKSFIITI